MTSRDERIHLIIFGKGKPSYGLLCVFLRHNIYPKMPFSDEEMFKIYECYSVPVTEVNYGYFVPQMYIKKVEILYPALPLTIDRKYN